MQIMLRYYYVYVRAMFRLGWTDRDGKIHTTDSRVLEYRIFARNADDAKRVAIKNKRSEIEARYKIFGGCISIDVSDVIEAQLIREPLTTDEREAWKVPGFENWLWFLDALEYTELRGKIKRNAPDFERLLSEMLESAEISRENWGAALEIASNGKMHDITARLMQIGHDMGYDQNHDFELL